MTTNALPEFEKPPVVETILGAQFHPLAEFRNVHLGAFWKTLGPDWSRTWDAPALEPQFEQFGESQGWAPSLQLSLASFPGMRVLCRNEADDRMIQLQNGRLVYNWLGHCGEDYPRYSTVRPEFDEVVERLRDFVEGESLGALQFNQWEVTYVNHVPRGGLWQTPSDWGDIVRLPPLHSDRCAGLTLEALNTNWTFEIPNHLGRLHVQLQRGLAMPPPGNEVLMMNFTARGPVAPDLAGRGLGDGLDLGHVAIVRLFTDMTTDEAHRLWKRKR